MYLSIDAITDVSKADSLIKAQEMGLLCTKYQLSTLYYKLFLTFAHGFRLKLTKTLFLNQNKMKNLKNQI